MCCIYLSHDTPGEGIDTYRAGHLKPTVHWRNPEDTGFGVFDTQESGNDHREQESLHFQKKYIYIINNVHIQL